MDSTRFDIITRLLSSGRSRRGIAPLLGGFTLGGVLTPLLRLTTEAKKKKRKKKRKKKKKVVPPPPDCASGRKLCQGQCIPQGACCTTADCTGGAPCTGGVCACPPGTGTCDGACTPTAQICEEFCCPATPECFADGCACEDFLCTCAEERTYCSTPDFTQCCLPGDDCDPVVACTTEVCTANNDVCTIGSAFCGETCLCTTSAAGDPFCADFQNVEDCPASSECDTDGECAVGETCANVPCCGDSSEFFGVCLPACPTSLAARASAIDRAHVRRRLERKLNLGIAWSKTH
jgi:hypothetical protein